MVKIKYIELVVNVHATESISKLIHSLRTQILKDYAKEIPIFIELFLGHYGNLISRISIFIDESKTQNIFQNICKNIINKDELFKNLNSKLDSSGAFYIRLDKQEFVKGKFVINDVKDDVIRVKVRFSPKVLKMNFEELIRSLCT